MVNYPGNIDTSTSLPSAVDGTTPVSSSQYNQTRDAVIAIENELGVLPSSIHGTVRNRLDYIESYIIAGGGVQLAQDLGGLATAPLVIGLYGNPILSTSPTLNYVLTWNGLAWEPKAPSIAGGDHNTLGTLQGGTTNQYYHLTSAQHVWLTAGVTTGYWDETKGGTGLTTYTTGDLLYADGTNSLGKLTIGSDGYVMRVTSGLPYWDSPSWTVLEGGTGISTVTTGDILYASASDTLSRLSAASDGYVLTMSGGVPVWSYDSSPTSHNALTGIQGGSGTDGYYHFTSYEHTWLQDGYATGYWDVIKGGTGVTSISTGDILYGSSSNTISVLSASSDGYYLSLSGGIPSWVELSTNHNNLNGLQGGTTNEYYHLTSPQYTWLIDGYVDGYWAETKGGTGLTSYTTGDILYASATNTLSKLAASTDGYILGLSSGVPVWQEYSPGVIDHNLLLGLQGGEVDGYYHLTPAQHTWLTDGYADGYWGETKGGTGLSSYTPGDILYASAINDLSNLAIGSSNQVLTVVDGYPSWQNTSVGTTDHNLLTNLQGGQADGYYHLTPGEHQFVVDGYDNGSFTDGYQLIINGTNVVWEPGYYHALFVGKIGAVSASTDGYLLQNLSISSDENFPAFITPIQSHAAMMRVKMSQAPGAGESVTVTLRKGGADTLLSVTVSDTATTGSNTTTLVSAIQGNSSMTVRVQTTSGAAVQDLAVSLAFYPDNSVL